MIPEVLGLAARAMGSEAVGAAAGGAAEKAGASSISKMVSQAGSSLSGGTPGRRSSFDQGSAEVGNDFQPLPRL